MMTLLRINKLETAATVAVRRVLLSALLAACSSPSSNLETGGSDQMPRDGGTTADAATASDGGLDARPKRTVERRTLFGRIDTPSNLVPDGDFEGSGYPLIGAWNTATASSYGPLEIRLAGACRSGLTCAHLEPLETLVTEFAVPPRSLLHVSFVARPASADCTAVKGALSHTDAVANTTDVTNVNPSAARPDEDGWCTYAADATTRNQPYDFTQFSVESSVAAEVDDVVMIKTGTARKMVSRSASVRLSGDDVAMRRLLVWHKLRSKGLAEQAAALRARPLRARLPMPPIVVPSVPQAPSAAHR